MCGSKSFSKPPTEKPMPPFPLRGLLHNLVYTVARDGNYLLGVGPMPDRQLHPPDAERLGEITAWMKINAEGIHGTRGGPYRDGDWGCKGNVVYLFLADRVGERLTLPALAAEIRSARRSRRCSSFRIPSVHWSSRSAPPCARTERSSSVCGVDRAAAWLSPARQQARTLRRCKRAPEAGSGFPAA
jgi:hypothetical protein